MVKNNMDIFKEKLENDKKITIETYTCGNCEGHFMMIKAIKPKPYYCPFCSSLAITINDELIIYENQTKDLNSGNYKIIH